ncbi:DsbA family oxidoreductase [Aestuariispira insulae]|uniref:Putative DsbA family dithiol-disulfide isomerase n=1 Tax=Aestuariispira insulae TaxID=1461337 RepID=A0A3D9HIV0_9PROT|nr:DsbA family oxidoreductase [Aestuariispira insulae]RED49201.1 putative DsbA family dithiol-disulfide isomerase [Aestuariispira insulae]
MMKNKQAPMKIDIVSDVVCPWCVVGYRQLEEALAESGIEAEIIWHPFELNPQMATDGENLREHLMAKYGSTVDQSRQAREQLTAVGETLGFRFNFSDESRIYNTFDAHRLIRWAADHGKAHDLKMALFSSYFTQGKNISDHKVLAQAAHSVGLDKSEAMAVLKDGRFTYEVRAEESFWTENGISGVPAVVFQQKHLMTGAQGVKNYRHMLSQLTAKAE